MVKRELTRSIFVEKEFTYYYPIRSVNNDFQSLAALSPGNCWQLGLAALLSIYIYSDFKTNCNL